MHSSTIVIIAAVVVCLALVVFNRYHHRQHHYNPDKLKETIEGILHTQPEKLMKRDDFINALKHRYNCHTKEALWLLGRAKEKGFVKVDEKWVELK